MRIRFFIALLPLLAVAASAQSQPVPRPDVYRIHKLILESTDLSRTQRDAIIHALQGGTYDLDELSERIRFKFRETGYESVEVGEARIIRLHVCDADVSYAVHRGSQYRLAGITFTLDPGKSVFTAAQLRSQFHLEDGAVFNTTEIGKGLENLKDLYGSAGYANFGAIPKPIYDNSRHTISLAIDIDQGFPVTFGKLFMEGIEPRAGAAQQLLASWKELEGKRYNSQLLREWLKNNSAERIYNQRVASADPRILNMLVHFQ
ncbi:MAG: POTRA domain-containing protein [Terracidiphilus sp.]